MKKNIEVGIRGAAAVMSGDAVAVKKEALDQPVTKNRPRRREYDAGKTTGPQALWMGASGDANYAAQTGLERLRARSRDADQNEAYSHDIIEKYVDLLVSTGIKPTPDTGDDTLNDKAWKLWQRWGVGCVTGSKLDIYGFERLVCRHLVMDGEGLSRFRSRRPNDMPGLPAFKLQPIEADLLPVSKTELAPNKNQIISGIEFDAIGELVAYHLLKNHPGASMSLVPFASVTDTVRVPAADMIHAFKQDRAGQVRGVPWLAPALLTLRDFHRMQYAVLVATEAIGSLAFIVKGGDSSDPLPGISPKVENGQLLTDAYGSVVEEIGPNTVAYAPDGKEIERTVPQMPTGVKEIVSMYIHEVSAALGLSYHTVSGDMSDASFAQAKLGLIMEAVHLAALRELLLIPYVLTPIWNRFVDEAVMLRLLPDRPELYNVRWTSPRIPRADENDEVKTAILKMQAGLESRQHIIESTGLDPDAVTAEIAADTELVEKLNLVFLGIMKQVNQFGLMQPYAPPDLTATQSKTDDKATTAK